MTALFFALAAAAAHAHMVQQDVHLRMDGEEDSDPGPPLLLAEEWEREWAASEAHVLAASTADGPVSPATAAARERALKEQAEFAMTTVNLRAPKVDHKLCTELRAMPGIAETFLHSHAPPNFLLVANNPEGIAALGLPQKLCAPEKWVAVHFNDCDGVKSASAPWAQEKLLHVLVRRQNGLPGTSWHGSDTSCEQYSIHVAKAFKMGADPHMRDDIQIKKWLQDGKEVSTGLTTAMALRHCFEEAKIVGAGFDFHADKPWAQAGGGPGDLHHFGREREYAAANHLFEQGNVTELVSRC